MRKQAGFTLIELMVVVAILGILAATAMPLYQTWTQRAYGTQATAMMKSLVDGQIMHYLEHNTFFPPDRASIEVFANDPPDKQEIQEISDALHVKIPTGQRLNYSIYPNYDGQGNCQIQISAASPIFKDGAKMLLVVLSKTGEAIYYTFG
jgi:prepilin-type N-terminal cleavage/methylation domain-containing protein